MGHSGSPVVPFTSQKFNYIATYRVDDRSPDQLKKDKNFFAAQVSKNELTKIEKEEIARNDRIGFLKSKRLENPGSFLEVDYGTENVFYIDYGQRNTNDWHKKGSGSNSLLVASSISPEITTAFAQSGRGNNREKYLYLLCSPEGYNVTEEAQAPYWPVGGGGNSLPTKYELGHYGAIWIAAVKLTYDPKAADMHYQGPAYSSSKELVWNEEILQHFNLSVPTTYEQAVNTLEVMGISVDENFKKFFEHKYENTRYHGTTRLHGSEGGVYEKMPLFQEVARTRHGKHFFPTHVKAHTGTKGQVYQEYNQEKCLDNDYLHSYFQQKVRQCLDVPENNKVDQFTQRLFAAINIAYCKFHRYSQDNLLDRTYRLISFQYKTHDKEYEAFKKLKKYFIDFKVSKNQITIDFLMTEVKCFLKECKKFCKYLFTKRIIFR